MSEQPRAAPVWMARVLVAAGVYNLLWGAQAVLFPSALFVALGIEPPEQAYLWRCIGMIVGVYGVGYLVAARDPLRHWPIVLVGFLGKVFGPIGYVMGTLDGGVPIAFGWTILTNDILWWAPFAVILYKAMEHATDRTGAGNGQALSVREAMGRARTHDGRALLEVSHEQRVLVVFLRHLGCTFCREAVRDLAQRAEAIRAQGARVALVHMGDADGLERVLARHPTLADAVRVADPERVLYRAFALRRGTFTQLFGARVFVRGVLATSRGHLIGKPRGDGFQMPGAFLIEDGQIVRAFRHRHAAERPDYESLACAVPAEA